MCVEVIDKEPSERSVKDANGKVRVGVAGLGLIGEGAVLRLVADGAYAFAGGLARDVSKPREAVPEGIPVTDDVDSFLSAQFDVVIDALPDGGAGKALIEGALDRGISIVSANKQAVAGSMSNYHETAARHGAHFRYSASVGGGAPMVETVRRARDAGEIVEMTAIVNGTVNYILTALAAGVSFADAVARAQEAGFAEPDPTADLSGDDARAKISILCYEAFGAEIDMASITTVALDETLADKIVADGGVYKQLSSIRRADDGAVTASLSYVKVADDDFFAGVRDEGNALRVRLADGRVETCADKGAGRAPTVDSLFADLETIRAALPPRQTD